MGFMMTFPSQQPLDRKALRKRFINVIRLAGYQFDGTDTDACHRICDKWFPLYVDGTPEHPANIPEFIKMLEEYEAEHKREGEIL